MHTASSSSRDAFFSFRIGKTVTEGIVEAGVAVGMGAQRLHSFAEMGGTDVIWGRSARFLSSRRTSANALQPLRSGHSEHAGETGLQTWLPSSIRAWFQSPAIPFFPSPLGNRATRSSAAAQRNLIVAGAAWGACTASSLVRSRCILPSTCLFSSLHRLRHSRSGFARHTPLSKSRLSSVSIYQWVSDILTQPGSPAVYFPTPLISFSSTSGSFGSRPEQISPITGDPKRIPYPCTWGLT